MPYYAGKFLLMSSYLLDTTLVLLCYKLTDLIQLSS